MSVLQMQREDFGALPDGDPVHRYVFGAPDSVEVAMLTYGATLQSVVAPDRHGDRANVVLSLPDLAGYRTVSPYLGATVGRFANRLAGGRFTLDGHTYEVPCNEGANAVHGGPEGFDKRLWAAEPVEEERRVGVRFRYVSPGGEMGFPGELTAEVTYTVDAAGQLSIEYLATTTAPTVVNLTNHAYFNLAGEGSGSVEGQLVWLNAAQYLPVDATSIPLGEPRPVASTAFDFGEQKPIGRDLRLADEQLVRGHGYDHNWVLVGQRPPRPGTVPAAKELPLAAWAQDPGSGRTLECWTTEPGVQFYTGNLLDGSLAGISGSTYRQGDGFTLETQHFPDSPNRPEYPSTVLRPDEAFTSATVFRFSTDG